MTTHAAHTIAEQIHGHFERFTASERKLAQILLSNYPISGLSTVADFSSQAGVSAPTVLRFVGKLGFSGYPQFQAKLRQELEERLRSPLSKNQRPDAVHPQKRDGLLPQFSEMASANIHDSLEGLSPAEFDRAAALIADTKRPVHILGGRLSGALAHYLYEHLRTIRPRVHQISGQNSFLTDHLLDMGKRHTLVAFDVRRYQDDIVRFAQTAHQQGVNVVLVTDQWLSPIARFAKHIFPLRIETGTTWDSAAAIVVFIEALLEATGQKNWQSTRRRIEQLEHLRDG
ncbi:MurR/RpiR family transcriptional regulator [Varunaivibrio sulfuroxidans]|uniref:RpiR family transcriptional regulator n=1 Tax=Varunaivibrio sulfuroxidans TaxID=1773489 RepID=A0A4R3JCF3_9PROT|nr:MurR/RpiR family transcriptional regulator [Varunaivibrio sulfuroxidans]TCS63432.1 RpiR family transcriptional regulator [Varunaivibrio sulfuroxidans]WES30422.1 MurR/RpiR family transcriptional regulator [Varunaivibrio sulfuroxidans]